MPPSSIRPCSRRPQLPFFLPCSTIINLINSSLSCLLFLFHHLMPMTSFQVEIAPPPSPFFQKNLNNLDLTDLWVHQPQWQATPAADTPPTTTSRTAPATPYANTIHYDDAEEAQRPKLDKWARAREIVFPANTSTAPPNSSSVEVSNSGGVSSLVQKWRVFETAAAKPPPPPPPPGTLTNDDDSIIGDWESDRTILSGRSSIRGRDSDATESERLRVADIIRKLTPNEAGCVSPSRTSLDHADLMRSSGSRVRTSLDQADLARSCRPPVACSPRIRGRQAYIDLLVQVERDRRKELQGLDARKPVSHFSHRGRIQAVLKLKFLRRAMEAKQGAHSYDSQKCRTFDSKIIREERAINPKPQIHPMHCSDKVPTDHNTPTSNSVHDSQQDCITTSPQHDFQQHNKIIQQNADLLHRYEEDDHHGPIFSGQETNSNHSLGKSAETEAAKTDNDKEEEEAVNYHDSIDDSESNQHTVAESAPYWEDDEGWEELQSDYQTKEANNRDWIDEVSRPRSDWEYLRQARYQEMLDPFMDKEDIRALLGRKSVSNFLSSGMRDKIDQLMISRTQGPQTVSNNNQRQDKRVQGQVGKQGAVAEEEYGEYFDGYEEADQSSQGQHYSTCDEYIDPSPSASDLAPPASWPENHNENENENENQNNQAHESSECSYQAVSPSTQLSSTNYCSQEMAGRASSYSAHPAIEMELIYDLRRHMDQLHQEISELRKSIKCSTDMQMKLHRSIKKEVTAALTHPDAKNGRRHAVKKSTNGSRRCCVCSKVQVDCVLYRCGHMCTCFECAHELHWSSGRCPICRAQIVDVIRTHSNF